MALLRFGSSRSQPSLRSRMLRNVEKAALLRVLPWGAANLGMASVLAASTPALGWSATDAARIVSPQPRLMPDSAPAGLGRFRVKEACEPARL